MQDSKEISWADNYDNDSTTESTSNGQNATNDASQENDGWQQYRKWISKAPAPRKRRMGVDPSLYTWKGYRSWSEKVRRDWQTEE